jgi:hypothetical protein
VRLRNTLMLLAGLVLLGAFVYFSEIQGQKALLEEPPFMEFSILDVARSQVQAREGPRMAVLHRGAAQWDMEEPYEAEGDFARLEGILVRLSSVKPKRVLTETALSFASFGLNDPQLTVGAELKDGSAQSLELGDQTPDHTSYYARRGGEQAALIEAATVDPLNGLVTLPPEKPTPVPTLPPADTPAPTAE